jgi:hypothetical protein
MNILGGFLAAVAFAMASALWKRDRRPFYVPTDLETCSDEAKQLLVRAGVGPGDVFPLDALVWAQPHDVPRYLAAGSRIIYVRPNFLRREVRSLHRDGYSVLMGRPPHSQT